MEKAMTKFGLLGAAAVLSSALTSPVMAQQVISNPGYCAQLYPNANCHNGGPGNRYNGGYHRRYVSPYNGDRNSDPNWYGDWINGRYEGWDGYR
jgi:hypothetical protein